MGNATVRPGWPPFAVWQADRVARRSPYYAASQRMIRMLKAEAVWGGYQGCLDRPESGW